MTAPKFRLLALILGVSVTNAQEVNSGTDTIYMPWEAQFGLIEHSTLNVSDEVTENCWTNSSAVRSKIYLIFEQNKIFVPDYVPAFYFYKTVSTNLSALGFRASNGLCVVSAEFKVQSSTSSQIGGANGKQKFSINHTTQLYERSSIFTNGTNSNSQISEFFEGAASEFVAKVLSSRRTKEVINYYKEYPSTNEPPMTQQKWNSILSGTSSSENE